MVEGLTSSAADQGSAGWIRDRIPEPTPRSKTFDRRPRDGHRGRRGRRCRIHVSDGRIPVTLAERPYPFPSRTRKLSSPAPKILRGQPFGKIGRRQDFSVLRTTLQRRSCRAPSSGYPRPDDRSVRPRAVGLEPRGEPPTPEIEPPDGDSWPPIARRRRDGRGTSCARTRSPPPGDWRPRWPSASTAAVRSTRRRRSRSTSSAGCAWRPSHVDCATYRAARRAARQRRADRVAATGASVTPHRRPSPRPRRSCSIAAARRSPSVSTARPPRSAWWG